MPIKNDSRMYSGGSAVFDSTPSTNIAIQLMQKNQAKQEAYDEYIRNLNKSVNPAGMRNQDREAFDDKLQKWRQFGIDNKNLIRKDPKYNMRFISDYQDLINMAEESKATEAKKKPLTDILFDPAKRDRLGDAIFAEIEKHDQPLYIKTENGYERNRDRKDLDYSSVTFNPKPFEQDKYFAQYQDLKRTDLPPTVVNNPNDLTKTVTTTSVFDPEAKETIKTRAVSDYFNNPSFREYIKNLGKDPAAVEVFSKVYKDAFGKELDTSKPEDLAAAYTMKGIQQTVSTSKLEDDKEAIRKANEAHDIKMQNMRNANSKELVAMRHTVDKKDEDLWYDSFVDSVVSESDNGKPMSTVLSDGKRVNGKEVTLTPTLEKVFGFDSKNPGTVMVTADKKFVPIFYETDSNYRAIRGLSGNYGTVRERSRPLSAEQVKVSLGKVSGVKQLNKEMTSGSSTKAAEATSESYSRSDLKAAGWSEDQINKAVKAGKIKVQ